MRPIVGIIGNPHLISGTYVVHGGSSKMCQAVSDISGCAPLIVAPDPGLASVEELLEACHGFVFTGGRSNIHPENYGQELTEGHGDMDEARDTLAFDLIRRLTERGQPYFGICRGFQEVAVAYGCSLHHELKELPGKMNHRMPKDGTPEQIRALRQRVTFEEGGVFERLLGARQVMTNTLHGQGVMETGPRIVIDGRADDGIPEALYVRDAPGFTLSVQWHPELNTEDDAASQTLFRAFGDAVRAWAGDAATPLLRSA